MKWKWVIMLGACVLANLGTLVLGLANIWTIIALLMCAYTLRIEIRTIKANDEV